MTCRVCGRGGCTESFHSLAEQEEADRRREDKYGTDDRCDSDDDEATPCARAASSTPSEGKAE